MTIVLISDGIDQQFACHQLAEQLRRHGRHCLTVGPPRQSNHEVSSHLPIPATDLVLSANELLGTSLLENADAIGLFLEDTLNEEGFATSYRTICRNRKQTPVPLFGGAISVDVGDRLIASLSKRQHLDLVLVPGDRHHAEAMAMTRHWPESLQRPDILSIGLWFMPERPPIGSLRGRGSGSGQDMPKTLVALVQKTIPTQVGGKTQLLKHLLHWAEQSPDWTVVVARDHLHRAAALDQKIQSGGLDVVQCGLCCTRTDVASAGELLGLHHRQLNLGHGTDQLGSALSCHWRLRHSHRSGNDCVLRQRSDASALCHSRA